MLPWNGALDQIRFKEHILSFYSLLPYEESRTTVREEPFWERHAAAGVKPDLPSAHAHTSMEVQPMLLSKGEVTVFSS